MTEVRWINIYKRSDCLGPSIEDGGLDHENPCKAQEFSLGWDGSGDPCFLRVEERWGGHTVCPPVGMRADQASHVYRIRFRRIVPFPQPADYEIVLEPRK